MNHIENFERNEKIALCLLAGSAGCAILAVDSTCRGSIGNAAGQTILAVGLYVAAVNVDPRIMEKLQNFIRNQIELAELNARYEARRSNRTSLREIVRNNMDFGGHFGITINGRRRGFQF